MLTVLAFLLTTARSGKPSSLKSPTAIAVGPAPLGSVRVGSAVNVPSPFPCRMETVPAVWLATARSTTVLVVSFFTLKNPVEIQAGPAPTVTVEGA